MSENSIYKSAEPKISVVGIGGAGSDMINGIIDLGVNDVKIVAIDTDESSLAKCRAPIRLQVSEKFAFEEYDANIQEDCNAIRSALVDRNVLIIVGDMDDKNVCNAATFVAQILQHHAQHVCNEIQIMAIVSASSMDGIDELKEVTNSVLVVPMHKKFSMAKDGALIENAVEAVCLMVKNIVDVIMKCNDVWKVCYNCKSCRRIAELEFYRVGGVRIIDDRCVWNELEKELGAISWWDDSYTSMFGWGCQVITKTYSDIMKTFNRGAGSVAISIACANDVFNAIEKACDTPFWDNVSIMSSLSVLVKITASERILSEWQPCFMDIEDLICGNKNTVVIFGEIVDFTMGDEVEVTIVAADFENKVID